MLRGNLGLAVAAAIVLTAHGAAAQGAWYLSGSAGGVLPMDFSRTVTITNPGRGLSGPATDTSTYTAGPAINAAIGYRLPLGFRVEGELGIQHFYTSTISPDSTDGTFPAFNGARLSNPSGGAHTVFTSTANLFYDLPFGFAGITPYAGGGAGYYDDNSTNAVFYTSQGEKFTARGRETGGAIVLGEIGASYPVSPSLSVVGSYRYEHLFHSGQTSTPAGANILKIGLRFTFGAPPAPTVAAASAVAPVPARTFLVFFDWDKASLTERARQIVAEAAARSAQAQSTRIEVDGYTDTSGTAAYNQGLSMRRAQTVAAELIKDGVPKAAISIQGFGETHPLVPTGAGVREPQNRRVEIITR